MATLTAQQAVVAGVQLSYAAAAAGGDDFPNDGNTYVILRNSSAGNVVTFAATGAEGGVDIGDLQVTVPAGESMLVGPFATHVFNDSSGQVAMTYDTEANLSIAVFKG